MYLTFHIWEIVTQVANNDWMCLINQENTDLWTKVADQATQILMSCANRIMVPILETSHLDG